MVEYIAKNLAIELMHQSSYLSDGDLLEVNGNLAKARIEAEPAADVAPVVHARWENYSPVTIKCSRCGHVIHDWRYSECKYCPNCGAKMDGGESDG